MESQMEITPNVGALIECARRIEGITTLVGTLADANDSAELEIIADALMETVEDMRHALKPAPL